MALIFNSWWLDIIFLVVSVVFYFRHYYKNAYRYWKERGVVTVQNPCAPFGNVKEFLLVQKTEAEVYQKMYNELQGHPFGGFYMFSNPRLLIRDTELIKQILVKDFSHFHDRGIKIDEKRSPLDAHLVNLGGKRWRNLRMKLTPTFTSGKLKTMFPILAECAVELNKTLQSLAKRGKVLDIKDTFASFTLEIIGSVAFGLKINAIEDSNSEFRKIGRSLARPSALRTFTFITRSMFPFLGVLMRPFFGKFGRFFHKLVTDMVQYREENNVQRNDFLQLLIELKKKGKVKAETSEKDFYLFNDVIKKTSEDGDFEFTDNLLAAQCLVFFGAGFETSSTTASYCLYELAVNQDIQERLRKEVDTVLKEYDGKITYDAIQKMKYLDQVVDETLRKYPPAMTLRRECTTPYQINGTSVTIEKGVKVDIPVFSLHRDPKYYPNPDKFDPERFSEENKSSIVPYSYIPFGEGPRICIGMRFGLLQTKVGLASLLTKFKFSLSDKTPVPLEFTPKGVVLSVKGGIWLKIEDRGK